MPRSKEKNEARIKLLADRLAICLVVLKMRFGTDWEPWFGESVWEEPDALGDEIRDWPEYDTAMKIVKKFIERSERDAKG
jgi:hypothetical protein